MSCKSRKPMTLEDHYEASTALREADESVRRLLGKNRWFDSLEVAKLSSALSSISAIKCRLDNELFANYKELDDKWGFLYYGEQDEADELMRSISERNE